MTFRVGDVVTVARACMENPAGSRALVVEVYDRQALRIGDGVGVVLLFQNGESDGFGPEDREAFGVTVFDHWPALADYHFVSALRLHDEWRLGRFDQVWT